MENIGLLMSMLGVLIVIGAFAGVLAGLLGVGGGIVAVVPGRMAIAAFSPRLNSAGNSVRGSEAIAAIAAELELSIFEAYSSH